MPKLAAQKYLPPSKYDLFLSSATFFLKYFVLTLRLDQVHYSSLGFLSCSTSGHWCSLVAGQCSSSCPHKQWSSLHKQCAMRNSLSHSSIFHSFIALFWESPSESSSAASDCVKWLWCPLSFDPEHGRHFQLIQDRALNLFKTMLWLCFRSTWLTVCWHLVMFSYLFNQSLSLFWQSVWLACLQLTFPKPVSQRHASTTNSQNRLIDQSRYWLL